MQIGYNLDKKELELVDNILSKGNDYVLVKINDYIKSANNNMFGSHHAYYKCCLKMIETLATAINRLDLVATIDDIHTNKLKYEKVNGKVIYQKPEKTKTTRKPRTKKVEEVKVAKEPIKFGIGLKIIE